MVLETGEKGVDLQSILRGRSHGQFLTKYLGRKTVKKLHSLQIRTGRLCTYGLGSRTFEKEMSKRVDDQAMYTV